MTLPQGINDTVWTVLPSPSLLSFTFAPQDTARYVSEIGLATQHSRNIILDFRELRRISLAAALYMAAEIRLCRRLAASTRAPLSINAISEGQHDVKERLIDYVVYRNLWPPSLSASIDESSDYIYIPGATLSRVESFIADRFLSTVARALGTLRDRTRVHLYAALIEAMSNVRQHAYPATAAASNQIRNRWWLAGIIHRPTHALSIVFHDHGVGLVNTVRNRVALSLGVQDASDIGDGDVIRLAAEGQISRTGQPNRGRGLSQIRQGISDTSGGTLRVISGRGHYIYHAGGIRGNSFPIDMVKGTMLKWRLPIDKR